MPIEQRIEQQFSCDTQWVPTALHSELHLPSMQFPLQPSHEPQCDGVSMRSTHSRPQRVRPPPHGQPSPPPSHDVGRSAPTASTAPLSPSTVSPLVPASSLTGGASSAVWPEHALATRNAAPRGQATASEREPRCDVGSKRHAQSLWPRACVHNPNTVVGDFIPSTVPSRADPPVASWLALSHAFARRSQ